MSFLRKEVPVCHANPYRLTSSPACKPHFRIYAHCARVYTDLGALMMTPQADSGINDRLVKLHPLIDQTCFELINVSCFVVRCI